MKIDIVQTLSYDAILQTVATVVGTAVITYTLAKRESKKKSVSAIADEWLKDIKSQLECLASLEEGESYGTVVSRLNTAKQMVLVLKEFQVDIDTNDIAADIESALASLKAIREICTSTSIRGQNAKNDQAAIVTNGILRLQSGRYENMQHELQQFQCLIVGMRFKICR